MRIWLAALTACVLACGEQNRVEPPQGAEVIEQATEDVFAVADTPTGTSTDTNDASTLDVGSSTRANDSAQHDSAAQDTYDPLALTDSTPPSVGDCETWCGLLAANCAAKDAIGADFEALSKGQFKNCPSWCKDIADYDPGTIGHPAANTLACRIHHAQQAAASATAAQNHCQVAGPTGGGVCGTLCQNYCHLMDQVCDGAYKNETSCLLECSGARGQYDGKVQCLLSQVLTAALDGQTKAIADACAASTVVNSKTSACNPKLPDAAATIKTQGNAFLPKEVTITAGESILFNLPQGHNAVEVTDNEWQNNGNKAKPGGFVVAFGQMKLITFAKAGIHYYVCQVHAAMAMKGRITVK